MTLRVAAVLALILSGLAAAVSAAPAHATAGIEIVPHRALYALSLGSAKNRSGVVGVDGKLAFEWADSCDGWTVEQRYDLRVRYTHGPEIEILTSYVSWESKDGLNYRFNVRRVSNGNKEEEYRGSATLEAKGAAGGVRYTVPEGRHDRMPAGTVFPTEHTELLLERAAAGERLFSRPVFDGATDDGTMLVNAFIAGPLPLRPDAGQPLANAPGWRVRLAFFPLTKESALPEYEVGLALQTNGIARSVELVYDDFVIKGMLDEVERLPAPGC
jgi:hypothetical protein